MHLTPIIQGGFCFASSKLGVSGTECRLRQPSKKVLPGKYPSMPDPLELKNGVGVVWDEHGSQCLYYATSLSV